MIFEQERLYTVLNANELENGSIGYASDDLLDIKQLVERDNIHMYEVTRIVNTIEFSFYARMNKDSESKAYRYFYLVEPPKPKEVLVKTVKSKTRKLACKIFSDYQGLLRFINEKELDGVSIITVNEDPEFGVFYWEDNE